MSDFFVEALADCTKCASRQYEWIQRAIPFLKSELINLSDILAEAGTPTGLGEDWDMEIDKKLEQDHKELTELLTQVGALEDD